jgi:hypothetical protein
MQKTTGTLLLEATSLVPLPHLLPHLRACLQSAGVWTEMPPSHSSGAVSLHLELSLHAIPPLYTALIRSGLHLRRPAHTALAALCSGAHLASAGNRDLRLDIRSLPAEHHLGIQQHAISA